MKRDASVLWVGARRSGKTFGIRYLVHEMCFKRAVVMAGSADCEEFHEQYIPKSYVYGEFNESKIEEIFQFQRYLKNLQKKGEDVDMELAIIVDDFGYDSKVMNSKRMLELYMNGRNYGLFVGVAVQYGTQFPKKLRNNVDVVFMFDERSRDGRVNLYKQFTNCFNSFDEFQEYMDACTQDGCAMVIDNTVKSTKVADKVFWYKPVYDLEPFTAGNQGYVAFDKIAYCTQEEHEAFNENFLNLSSSSSTSTNTNKNKETGEEFVNHEGRKHKEIEKDKKKKNKKIPEEETTETNPGNDPHRHSQCQDNIEEESIVKKKASSLMSSWKLNGGGQRIVLQSRDTTEPKHPLRTQSEQKDKQKNKGQQINDTTPPPTNKTLYTVSNAFDSLVDEQQQQQPSTHPTEASNRFAAPQPFFYSPSSPFIDSIAQNTNSFVSPHVQQHLMNPYYPNYPNTYYDPYHLPQQYHSSPSQTYMNNRNYNYQ